MVEILIQGQEGAVHAALTQVTRVVAQPDGLDPVNHLLIGPDQQICGQLRREEGGGPTRPVGQHSRDSGPIHSGTWAPGPPAPDSPWCPGTGHSLPPSWNGLVPSAFEVSFLPTHPDPQAPRALSWGLTALVLLVPLSAVAITADTGQGLFLFHQVTASFMHGHSSPASSDLEPSSFRSGCTFC